MIPLEDIRQYAAQIAERFHPQRIILFGSQARGMTHPFSDADILVVMSFEGKAMRKAVEIRHELRCPFALDLIVRRPEEVANRVEERDFFLQEAIDQGIVLYDQRND
jgi:predicted nucleotidyltransferase